ncbi:MAG: LysM peptidoglycan-binding domain-containing protein [Gallionella sp.]
MRKIISLICLVLPILAHADEVQIRADAPDRHIVVKGDTLWGISGLFYKDPLKWPNIWNINKVSIKDPHWIYPGDVVMLDRSSGSLSVVGDATSGDVGSTGTDKYSPRARASASQHEAITSISFKDIDPFLSQPLVLNDDSWENTPKIIALQEGRVILGRDEKAYAAGMTEAQGEKWQVVRPGKMFKDPETGEELGREAIYLGQADAIRFGEVSTLMARKVKQEINKGDRLYVMEAKEPMNYVPRAPSTDIKATVISIYSGVTLAGQNAIITLNKGARDGIEKGHVLALLTKGKEVKHDGENYTLPDEETGKAFVFRVFDKVSYALIMETKVPVQVSDRAQTP